LELPATEPSAGLLAFAARALPPVGGASAHADASVSDRAAVTATARAAPSVAATSVVGHGGGAGASASERRSSSARRRNGEARRYLEKEGWTYKWIERE